LICIVKENCAKKVLKSEKRGSISNKKKSFEDSTSTPKERRKSRPSIEIREKNSLGEFEEGV
jgi:hypothetical protein